MRTRTLIAGAAFLAVAAGAGKASAQLRGSDTLDVVTTQVIASCPGTGLTYVGGGSTLGQGAMVAGTQHVSPMSRQLNAPACTASARQLLIGLDGLAILTRNPQHTDNTGGACTDGVGTSTLVLNNIPSQFVLCTSNTQCVTAFGAGAVCDTQKQYCLGDGVVVPFCTTAQGCSPAGTYTFDNNTAATGDDWKDVVAQIYAGQIHTTTGATMGEPGGVAPIACTDDVPCRPFGRTCNITAGVCNPHPDCMNGDGVDVCQTSTTDTAGACTVPSNCPAPASGIPYACVRGVCTRQIAAGANRNAIRNPGRMDCANPVRGALLASYSQIVQNPVCTVPAAAQACALTTDCPLGQTCTANVCTPPNFCKLRHAFRRDDLSGTTDAFRELVSLAINVPDFTTMRSIAFGAFAPEIADFASTASPFCNASTQAQNKGFSDGADRDPYRRACTTAVTSDRTPYEEVCEAGLANPNTGDISCYVNPGTQACTSDVNCAFGSTCNAGTCAPLPVGARPANYPTRDKSAPQGRGHIPAGATDPAGTLLAQDVNGTGPGLLWSRQRCLGVVLPISIPQEQNPGVIAQFGYLPSDTPGIAGSVAPSDATRNLTTIPGIPALGGGLCNAAGARAIRNQLPGRLMVCTDGGIKQNGGTCRLPISSTATGSRNDCLYDNWGGQTLAAQDPRAFNLTPVNNVGNMTTIVDNYQNAYYSGVSILQRFAKRFYGLHMVRPDNSQTTAPSTAPCRRANDTDQIGCLVKTSPCSVGYAGREGADKVASFDNLTLRINNVSALDANIQALVTGVGTLYPITRGLWFNSFQDPAIGFATPSLTAGEQTLATCMGLPSVCTGTATACTTDANCANDQTCNLTTMQCECAAPATCDAAGTGRCTFGNTTLVDSKISGNNFVTVPAGIRRFKLSAGAGCPITFP